MHVFRDGRLLSVQNFNMGSYEIDTSRFPYGVYDVTVDIVVNGRTVNTRMSRVNKIFSRQQAAGLHGSHGRSLAVRLITIASVISAIITVT